MLPVVSTTNARSTPLIASPSTAALSARASLMLASPAPSRRRHRRASSRHLKSRARTSRESTRFLFPTLYPLSYTHRMAGWEDLNLRPSGFTGVCRLSPLGTGLIRFKPALQSLHTSTTMRTRRPYESHEQRFRALPLSYWGVSRPEPQVGFEPTTSTFVGCLYAQAVGYGRSVL